jgi:hypothetical protein
VSKLQELRKLHAAALNLWARCFGALGVFIGVVFTIWGLSLILHREATVTVNGVPTNDPFEKRLVLGVGLVVFAMGVLVLKAKPYKPRK